MKCSKTDGMLCLRDDLPLTKIMLCFLFVVFNNIASLNTFGSELTPNEEESLQNVQTCGIMFRLSLFVVLIQTSHPTTDLWLEETYCGVFFSNVFHKTTQSQRANFCPQLHPCKSSKVYKFAHVQWRGLQKNPAWCLFGLLCLKIQIIYSRHAWPLLQEANKQNIDTLCIYQ